MWYQHLHAWKQLVHLYSEKYRTSHARVLSHSAHLVLVAQAFTMSLPATHAVANSAATTPTSTTNSAVAAAFGAHRRLRTLTERQREPTICPSTYLSLSQLPKLSVRTNWICWWVRMGAINSKVLPLTLFSLPDGPAHLAPPVVTPKCAPVLTARQARTSRPRHRSRV